MNPGWQISKQNFTENDGSLPTVELTQLSSDSLCLIVKHFFASGTIDTVNPTFYDNVSERDLELSEVTDPTKGVISGIANPFHCCFSGLSWKGVEIPVLGLFVFSDSLEIDYRMGSHWSPQNVDAFFNLISFFISLDTATIVASAESEGLPFPDQFSEALNYYSPNRKQKEA